jgi:hypothetical protein
LWERGHRFVRYADDIRVFVRSERAARRVLDRITEVVEQRLKLKVNRAKSGVRHARQAMLLGFGFHISSGRVRIRVDPAAIDRMRRRIRYLTGRNRRIAMEQRIEALNRFITGWCAYFWLAEAASPFTRADSWLRRRLRQVRWKEWKIPKARIRALRALGIPANDARKMGQQQHGPLADRAIHRPPALTPQLLLDQPGPAKLRRQLPPASECLTNRRMRARMSGGVREGGATPPPTRSKYGSIRQRSDVGAVRPCLR